MGTFQFLFALAVVAWATYIMLDGPDLPGRYTRLWQFCLCVVLGWATALLLEGLGLIGPYTGPLPHM
jgi:hypothetical protein